MKKLLLAFIISLASTGAASAQDVQGVYVCNDTSDPVAWKVHCAPNHDPLADRQVADTWKQVMAGLAESWKKNPTATGRLGGLLKPYEPSAITPEDWTASLGR